MSEELEQYHQKGGTYVIPVEIMNYWLGEYENLESVIDKAINELDSYINFCENESQGHYEICNMAIHKMKNILKILRGKK